MSESHHIESVYSDGAAGHEVSRLGDYLAVVDPIAWQLSQSMLPVQPIRTLVPHSLERDELDALATHVPKYTSIVGIGGGTVMDATKYLAAYAESPPVLIPSITSSNAPFSDAISVRQGGEPTGMVVRNQPKRVVVDLTLIAQADARLNRAGFADLLAYDVILRDACIAARDGAPTLRDSGLTTTLSSLVRACHANARAVGGDAPHGAEFIMRSFEQIEELFTRHDHPPVGAGSEHLIAWNVETVTGRRFIHGELVALGLVVVGVVADDGGVLRHTLDQAGIRYRLRELGLTWDELVTVLQTVDEYNRRTRRLPSIFTDLTWTQALLAAVYDATCVPVAEGEG